MTEAVAVPVTSLPGGVEMPMIGFGTWRLRGRTGREAVASALSDGYRHIDTATMYRNEHEVGQALRDGDAPRLREAAHKLGGMVASFSATAAEATALLALLGREGKIEEALQTYSRLTALVGRLVAVADTLSVEQLRRRFSG